MPGSHFPNGVQLGGLGTGRIELGANGRITLAGVTNNWQRLLAGVEGAFFSLRVESDAGVRFHLLQTDALDGFDGMHVEYSGLHPVARARYGAAACPIAVDLTAFASMVPHDLTQSSIPGAVFVFRLINQHHTAVRVRLAFSWEHLLGCGGAGNRGMSLACDRSGNEIKPWVGTHGRGLLFTGGNPRQLPNTRGEMVLAVTAPEARVWSYVMWNVLADR
ncbi:MAG: GH116 family glycosyl-hydrolase, partial [bacterium]